MELVCKECGADVSGPGEKSVKETMARHMATKHPKGKK
jgi:hypothetical protein